MHQDDERIMARRGLERAPRHQPLCVAAREDEFGDALQRDESEDRDCKRVPARPADRQRASSSGGQRHGRDRKAGAKRQQQRSFRASAGRSTRSSTNSAVGADMLPKRFKHLALMVERLRRQVERAFDRLEHLAAAGMADEARDLGAGPTPCASQNAVQCRPQDSRQAKRGIDWSKITPKPIVSTASP